MKENKKQKILNSEQNALVAELVELYGIEPDDIIFFSEKPEPHLSYSATCKLCNVLVNPDNISIEPIPSVSDNSLSLKCDLLIGMKNRSGVGVVNRDETIEGKQMSDAQIYELASSRAIRNALKNASIDLVKLHKRRANGEDVLEFNPKSAYKSKLAEAHALGHENGLINGNDKRGWYGLLWSQYQVTHSNDLNDQQLNDFVALLRSFKKRDQKQAA